MLNKTGMEMNDDGLSVEFCHLPTQRCQGAMGTSQRGARLRRLATEIERSGAIIVHAGIPRAAFATVEPVTLEPRSLQALTS